jgi:serine/threonine-protein kinase SRPK3
MSSYGSSAFGSTSDYDWTGQIIDDNYILIKKLGCGSFSAVWLCYSLRHKKCFAIKILNPEDYESGMDEIDVFKQLAKYKSQHIISLVDHFIIPVPEPEANTETNAKVENDDENSYEAQSKYEHVCIVMELMFCSLYDLLKNCNRTNKYLPLEFIKKVIYQTLIATNVLHNEGIIHTDIKPENILIPFDYAQEINKILDVNQELTDIHKRFSNANIQDLICKNVSNLRKKINKHPKIMKKLAIKELVYKMLETNQNNKITKAKSKHDSDNESTDSSNYDITRHDISDDEISNELAYTVDNDLLCDKWYDKLKIKQNFSIIPDDWLQNISIKLSDLGTCIFKNKLTKFRGIQTRHYRAPEVVLKTKYDEKCDIWSIGCCIYELLTLELLFDPYETNTISCDRFHISDFVGTLGAIPADIIDSSVRKNVFFKKNGYIRGIGDIRAEPLLSSIQIINNDVYKDEKNVMSLFALMENMLKYNCKERFGAQKCIEQELFGLYNKNNDSSCTEPKSKKTHKKH